MRLLHTALVNADHNGIMQEWSSGYNYSDFSGMIQSSLGWISSGYQPANVSVPKRSFPLLIGELGAFISSHNVSITCLA